MNIVPSITAVLFGAKRRRDSRQTTLCVSVQLPNCAITSNKALEDKNAGRRAAPLSGCSERDTSVGANPLHHGTEAIRALRREMFAQTHAFEQFDGTGVQDLSCALARIDSEQDCNQSAHDMGSLSPAKVNTGPPAPSGRTVVSSQTWLAQP